MTKLWKVKITKWTNNNDICGCKLQHNHITLHDTHSVTEEKMREFSRAEMANPIRKINSVAFYGDGSRESSGRRRTLWNAIDSIQNHRPISASSRARHEAANLLKVGVNLTERIQLNTVDMMPYHLRPTYLTDFLRTKAWGLILDISCIKVSEPFYP